MTEDLMRAAIADAENRASKLTAAALSVPGYTSVPIRHLMNNLGALARNYLEIGVHKGGTFCSTIFENALGTAVAIDKYSEFDDGNAEGEFIRNVDEFKHPATAFAIIREDCWDTIRLSGRPQFDLFLYDGDHGAEAQYKACNHFLRFMTDTFMFAVDDYSAWPSVKKATEAGIRDSGCRIIFERELWNNIPGDSGGWHNGFYLALLSK